MREERGDEKRRWEGGTEKTEGERGGRRGESVGCNFSKSCNGRASERNESTRRGCSVLSALPAVTVNRLTLR